MREITAHVAGSPRPVWVAQNSEDTARMLQEIQAYQGPLAFDTETTDLAQYSAGFRVRLVQFGTKKEAWVFPVDAGIGLGEVREILRTRPVLVAHNVGFDLQALKVVGLIDDLGEVWGRCVDTMLLAHLVDPRGREDGGVGHALKPLCVEYFDLDASEDQKALLSYFREMKWSEAEGWAQIDLWNPLYLRYSGEDTILAAWLYEALRPLIVARGFTRLSSFEHEVGRIASEMAHRGVLVDREYLERLGPELERLGAVATKTAESFGVSNVNATAQVTEALLALGADLTETTPKSGKLKADKAILEGIVATEGPAAPLAEAIMVAKNMGKFRTNYVDSVLAGLDSEDRIHPTIRTLKARTARMSIANPPLQQLPSGDWKIRRAFISDPGQLMGASDYNQVEMRVLAALAPERAMLRAIRKGVDLHDFTATILFGEGFTKSQRKTAKNTGFGKVYGGGAATLARQAAIPVSEAKKVISAYDRAFPGIKTYGRKLMDRAEMGKREVVTPTGRHLPLDRDRLYAATNYVVQSTARDVLCQALIEIDSAGLGDHLLLPIHDEVLFQAPASEFEEVSRAIGEAMTFRNWMGAVDLTASGELYGASWGHGYGATS